ncbi:MAG: hypothetical protein AB1690_03545 [Candidatus Zixiibacteriota bacterium]
MRPEDNSEIQRSKYVKAVKYSTITVLLGAIGSGLWDVLLSPIFEFLSTAFLSMLASIFEGYVNNLHREIGFAETERFTLLPYLILITFLLMYPWIMLFVALRKWKFWSDFSHSDDQIASNVQRQRRKSIMQSLGLWMLSRKRRVIIFFTAWGTVMTLGLMSISLMDWYTHKACIYVERSLEILAPSISSEEFLALRAAYRSVDSAEKFYSLDNRLRTLASARGLVLPVFTAIK